MKNKILVLSTLIILIASGISFRINRENYRKRCDALGLNHASYSDARLHIRIVEELPTNEVRSDLFPVHIMYRPNKNLPWNLAGTGTYLKNYTPGLVSAYHLFSGRPGEYGYRKISRELLMRGEPILPIVGFTDPLNDDVILCKEGEGTKFPHLSVPARAPWNPSGANQITAYPAHGTVQLLTRPQRPRKLLYWTEIKPGIRYIFFEGETARGESGTGGLIDPKEDSLLVVLQKGFLNFSTPIATQNSIGVGVLISFGIKK